MKRIIIVLAIMAVAATVYAQADPSGLNVKIADGVYCLRTTDKTFLPDFRYYPDTLTVGSGKWTQPFKSHSGYVRIEGVAILTAGTDSFVIRVYGSNSQYFGIVGGVDTTMLELLDSYKVLSAGLYHHNAVLANKGNPWMVLEYVPLNPGATITGKTRRNSIWIQ